MDQLTLMRGFVLSLHRQTAGSRGAAIPRKSALSALR
jgi:hypothetical protein